MSKQSVQRGISGMGSSKIRIPWILVSAVVLAVVLVLGGLGRTPGSNDPSDQVAQAAVPTSVVYLPFVAGSPPTATATPTRTATPTNTPTNTATPTPTQTPTPSPTPFVRTPLIYGADDRGYITGNATNQGLAWNAGIDWVRVAISWASMEPNAPVNGVHTYNWGGVDSVYNTLHTAGFTPYFYVTGNPCWAATWATNCPTDPSGTVGPVDLAHRADQAAFIGALAKHFKDYNIQVPYLGFYQEIDNTNCAASSGGCFGNYDFDGNGVRDYIDYANMLQGAYQALHANNANMKLVIGSSALDGFTTASSPQGYPSWMQGSFDFNFLPNLFTYIRDNPPTNQYLDAVAFNYYPVYRTYWESLAPAGTWGLTAKAYAMKQRESIAGLDLPIHVVEAGDYSHDDFVTGYPFVCPGNGTERQSRSVVKIYSEAQAANKIVGVMWWTFAGPEWADFLHHFGLIWGPDEQNPVMPAFQPKPSYNAYKFMTTQLSGYQYVGTFSPASGVAGYRFSNGTSQMVVVWTEPCTASSGDSAPQTVSFASLGATRLEVWDKWGTVLFNGNGNTWTVTGSPIYVLLNP